MTIPKRDGLLQAFRVMTEQPRTVDRKPLIDGPLTRLTAEETLRVESGFKAVTGLYD